MPSPVSITSNALLMLGAEPIGSFNDGTASARIASNLYPSVRDSMLRAHPWNCCIKRQSLAPDATAPLFDWPYAFTLPSDCTRVLSVGELGDEESHLIEGRKLLTCSNPALLRYVFRNANEATWDDMLVDGMTLAMAARMAYGITKSSALRDSMRQEFMQFMKVARSVDGQEDPPQTLGDSPLLQARFGGSSRDRRLSGSPTP